MPGEVRTTSEVVLVEQEGEGVRTSEIIVLTEMGGRAVYATSMLVLVEMELQVIDEYTIGIGHNVPSSFQTRLNPQPSLQGQFITRRTHSPNTKLLDEFKYTYHQYNVVKSITQYRSILNQYGLLAAETSNISLTAKDGKYDWDIYNGRALQPELGEDVEFSRFFIRNLRIYITELELQP